VALADEERADIELGRNARFAVLGGLDQQVQIQYWQLEWGQ